MKTSLEILWYLIQIVLMSIGLVFLFQLAFAECSYLEVNHRILLGTEVCVK